MFSSAPISVSDIAATGCVAALGCFDGLHTGHRKIFSCAKEQASRLALPLVVYSPEAKKGQSLLTPANEKKRLLYHLGADCVILADFEKIKDLSPEQFVTEILCRTLNCHTAVCGYNFSFGHQAAGDSALLHRLMTELGRRTLIQSEVNINGSPVSSTRIRSLLLQGYIQEANELLEQPYFVTGTVSHGRAIGRTLGFPTLNLSFQDGKLIPKNGVYYSRVITESGIYGAVSNIGMRPTFSDCPAEPVLEAHLLNFSGDLYQQAVTVELIHFLRPETAFRDSNALAEAVHRDITAAYEMASTDPILLRD
ncbi:MAG: riboflavin biosynthesis protein RibF [Ruminococcaceae bacterium]|nr:riboflavin biosynthesis protein RibF [Oscillospiraceae bacterium]